MTNVRPWDPRSPHQPADTEQAARDALKGTVAQVTSRAAGASLAQLNAMYDFEHERAKPRKGVVEALNPLIEQRTAEATRDLEAKVQQVLAASGGKSADELQAMIEAEEESESPRKTLLDGLNELADAAVEREAAAREAAEDAAAEALAASEGSGDPDGQPDDSGDSEGS